jgi:predicted Rossmann-fold nucleotide-binding protein
MDPAGSVFLGCTFEAATEDWLHRNGALIFPTLPGVPFDPYRGQVYTAAELYSGLDTGPYEGTLDAQVYAWSSRSATRHDLDSTLAASLHDHAIGDAMEALFSTVFAGRRMVGVMGGHAAERGSTIYDGAARLGRLLAREGYAVATGGGPGAMEAANLGARLSASGDEEFADALDRLAGVPGFRPSVTDWARAAADVLAEAGPGVANLGIPTWHYGHEPPNLFATHIAKYFGNALREAVLLQRCDGGIVFLPGAGGTVQEIFQDACENYYATPEALSPMVLVGRKYWTEELPAWPLLQALARGRSMEGAVHLVDTVEQALDVL